MTNTVSKRSLISRALALLLCCTLALSMAGCGAVPAFWRSDYVRENRLSKPQLTPVSADPSENVLRAAVLYDGADGGESWKDTYSRLCQPLLLGLNTDAVDISGEYSLAGYDLLYPDEGIMRSANADSLKRELREFTEAGGGLFLTNGFYSFFDADFLGAKSFSEVPAYPYFMQYPEVDEDLGELQSVIADFFRLYEAYPDFPELENKPLGVGMKPSSAVALAIRGGLSLFSVNEAGRGYVLLCGELLPNKYSISGTDMLSKNSEQRYFSDSSMSAARLIENAFAAFCAKRWQGFALWRVFGSYGAPAMSWELHFEEIEGFHDGSGVIFADMCEEYEQIPSYTLIRNTYTWFLRAESVTTLLGENSGGSFPAYSMSYNENAYSSGVHVAAGGKWLSIAEIEQGGSYFTDNYDFDLSASPYVADLNRDGRLDIICGSSDGYIRYFEGLGFSDRLITREGVKLTDTEGAELNTGCSSPVVADVDGDGLLDILSGTADGGIVLFMGTPDGYAPGERIVETGLSGKTLPALGDMNGDGVPDLIIGSNEGRLLLAFGEGGAKFGELREISALGIAGNWLAPCAAYIDSDADADLLVGTADGYIAKLTGDGAGNFANAGFVELDEKNYKGNYNAKFGNNCVPRLADLNGDGIADLVCGSLEYGMAYPIDSEYFPYRQELSAALDSFKERGYYLGVHFYTNSYASPEREKYELDAHLSAMRRAYGVGSQPMGANQHTWYTSTNDPRQSLLSAWNAGLLWNSGYAPANDPFTAPQYSARNLIALPFYLMLDGEHTILLQNCSTVLYFDESWTDISAHWDMPVCLYYHCDTTAKDVDTARANIETAEAFRVKHGYSFVREDQLMYASAAAINLTVDVSAAPGEGFGITLEPGCKTDALALYSASYQNACGVRLSLGKALANKQIATDAAVCRRVGNDIYLGLGGAVTVSEAGNLAESPIRRVNLPADISLTDAGAVIAFREGGLMEVCVEGEAEALTEGWKSQKRDGNTLFTRIGDAGALEISFGG